MGLTEELRAVWIQRHLGLIPQSGFEEVLEDIRARLGRRIELEDHDLRQGGTRFTLRDRETRISVGEVVCRPASQDLPV
jgi:hypothetical protein